MFKSLLLGGLFGLALICGARSSSPEAVGEEREWSEPYHPYRVGLELASKEKGKVRLEVSLEALMSSLRAVCPEAVNANTFAFEKAVLVDPATGRRVGRFLLRPEGGNLLQNPEFKVAANGSMAAWRGYDARSMHAGNADLDGKSVPFLEVAKRKVTNTALTQPVTLQKGGFYLLDAWVRQSVQDGQAVVDIANPKKKLFLSTTGSYVPPAPPEGEWVRNRSLYCPDMSEGDLRLATGFEGTGAFAQPLLREAKWELLAELPSAADRLWLYYVPRAGHKLTVPAPPLVVDSAAGFASVAARISPAEHADLNPGGFSTDAGGCEVWSVPAAYPLRAGYLGFAKTKTPARTQTVDLFQGGSQSLVLAIKVGTPLLQVLEAKSDLPVEVRFERIAPIPVYDGPYPTGKLQQTRYDALLACDDPAIPPAPDGVHLVAVTFHALKDTAPGRYEGSVTIRASNQTPQAFEIHLPVTASVLPVYVKPMDHFGTSFGAQFFTIRYSAASNPFIKGDGYSIADFHGYRKPPGASGSLKNDPYRQSLRKLATKYFREMLGYDLVPHGLSLFTEYTYKVEDRGEGKAPGLGDWDFSSYDTSLDELVIAEDIPLFTLFHSNGQQMDRLRLRNGMTYSFREPQGKIPWKQLPREEFYALVGHFFDALAAHLETKGVLDRAFFLIDESDPSTYPVIRDFVAAVKATPFGKRIRFGHTTYKPGTYTAKDGPGHLALDGVLDIPMPSNDDHGNLFEPAVAARLKTHGPDRWVYYVESDHFDLLNAGLTTALTPLKLNHFGVNGWLCWGAFIWSMPYPEKGPEYDNEEFRSGPIVNPWLNPFYHHGPGALSFFYPPDPRGLSPVPTDKVVPSYRLSLMRDGIQTVALLKVLEKGMDDAGRTVAVDREALGKAKKGFDSLCSPNPVQWYPSVPAYEAATKWLYRSVVPEKKAASL